MIDTDTSSAIVKCNPPMHIFLKPTVGERCQCGKTQYEYLCDD